MPKASDDHICFVTYPVICTENNISQSLRYLQTFEDNNEIKDFSIVITALYKKGDNIYELVEKVLELQKNIPIILRIRYLKAIPAIQIYEAAFSYCPKDSLFFTSRVNVAPVLNNLPDIKTLRGDKTVILFNYRIEKSEKQFIREIKK